MNSLTTDAAVNGPFALNGYYRLINDTPFTVTAPNMYEFQGIFEGDGKTVNLKITTWPGSTSKNVGLFCLIQGGIVRNLRLTGSMDVTTDALGSLYVGALAGKSGATVRNVSSSVDVSFKRPANPDTLPGAVGGLIGFVPVGVGVINCYTTGDVYGEDNKNVRVGGLFGATGGLIQNCYAAGNVEGKSDEQIEIGGIMGDYHTSNPNTVSNCAALNPSITASYASTIVLLGRVIGGAGNTISNNYARDDMTVTVNNAPYALPAGDCAADKKSGASVALTAAQNQSWWESPVGWTAANGAGFGSAGTATAASGGDNDWTNGNEIPWKWDIGNKRPKLWFE